MAGHIEKKAHLTLFWIKKCTFIIFHLIKWKRKIVFEIWTTCINRVHKHIIIPEYTRTTLDFWSIPNWLYFFFFFFCFFAMSFYRVYRTLELKMEKKCVSENRCDAKKTKQMLCSGRFKRWIITTFFNSCPLAIYS